MNFQEKSRRSDSDLIEKVWYSRGDTSFQFLSYAEARSEIVFVTSRNGVLSIFLRGPETAPSTAQVPAGGECLGVQLRLGAYIPSSLPRNLMDRRDAELPIVEDIKVLIDGHRLEVPTYENAEGFVMSLLRLGIIRLDRDVVAILDDEPNSSAIRTMQVRFIRATGLSHSLLTQILRTRELVDMLRSGRDVNDVVFDLKFYDQAHLYRNLRRFVGVTARGITEAKWVGSLLEVTDLSNDC